MFKLKNEVYDVLKWVVSLVLPALGTAYFGLAQIWGFPYAEQIVGTISVVETFLGVVLKISCSQYGKEDGNGKDKG